MHFELGIPLTTLTYEYCTIAPVKTTSRAIVTTVATACAMLGDCHALVLAIGSGESGHRSREAWRHCGADLHVPQPGQAAVDWSVSWSYALRQTLQNSSNSTNNGERGRRVDVSFFVVSCSDQSWGEESGAGQNESKRYSTQVSNAIAHKSP